MGRYENKRIYELHAQVCRTLSSPRRLEILHRLRGDEKNVSDLIRETGYRKANLSQHLSVMRSAGVLRARRNGRNIFYRVASPKMLRAYDLLREVLFEHMGERQSVLRGAMAARNRKASGKGGSAK